MKSELTYSEAFSQLTELVAELEDGNIQLDKLATKVKQANELIAICENKLRVIETEVNDAVQPSKTAKKKKGS